MQHFFSNASSSSPSEFKDIFRFFACQNIFILQKSNSLMDQLTIMIDHQDSFFNLKIFLQKLKYEWRIMHIF